MGYILTISINENGYLVRYRQEDESGTFKEYQIPSNFKPEEIADALKMAFEAYGE